MEKENIMDGHLLMRTPALNSSSKKVVTKVIFCYLNSWRLETSYAPTMSS